MPISYDYSRNTQSRDVFGFDSLLAPPMATSPKFLKCSTDDKAEAVKMKRQSDKKIIKK
ncbi:hypothetical protein G7B40_024875 [Aetokthonos hydrillicola Thurmond2011]|uniref:Uncharacterized protein n=1 Tax=Aetokthonos hydrillicola Thurmond2011 TaxID=2712845 RepID=A0AAP5IA84_9CYAN|nr:hypothetical protein [Aetokthonos hydrillicola]MBO3458504.1 hypothetical protein [Aetokthonos hydrillicola CCALA 1050]MBW4586169.1 hypothetical protein [Aetokthonos hydrillicola CCALA 1050]MDR9897776.1 hypothetical protein [Aetokthonos hydrillicola Thurmond2011]